MAIELPGALSFQQSVADSTKRKLKGANLSDPLAPQEPVQPQEPPADDPITAAPVSGAVKRAEIGSTVGSLFDQTLSGMNVPIGISGASGAQSPDVKPDDAPAAFAMQPSASEGDHKQKKAQTDIAPADGEPPDVITNLENYANNALTATEDPNSQRIFNHAIVNLGRMNQAEKDALQMRINQNPGLSGQGAGYFLLDQLAMTQGARRDDLIIKLSIEAADRIRDLNQWGFEKSMKIWEKKEQHKKDIRDELLASGDTGAWASQFKSDTGIEVDVAGMEELSPATQAAVGTQMDLMEAAIANGDMDQARIHWDNILALSPNAFKGADFDSMGFEDQSYILKSEADDEIWAVVRTDVMQGDWENAADGIVRLFPDEQIRIDNGKEAINTMDLNEINEILMDVGKPTIESKDDLIGIEDEFFVDKELSQIKGNTEVDAVAVATKDILNNLKQMGYDVTDPDIKQSVHGYVFDLQMGNGITVVDGEVIYDVSKLLPPWDENSKDSHLYTDWPYFKEPSQIGTDQAPFYEGWQNIESNEVPGKLSEYQGGMDRKWEKYLATTPKDEQMNRKEWFYATKGGTVAAPEKTPASDVKVDDSDGFAELISAGGEPTAENIKVLASTSVENLPYGENWSKPELDRLGQYVNVNGTGFQMIGGFQSPGSMIGAVKGATEEDVLILKGMDGQIYMLVGEGSSRNWYELDSKPDTALDLDYSKKTSNPAG